MTTVQDRPQYTQVLRSNFSTKPRSSFANQNKIPLLCSWCFRDLQYNWHLVLFANSCRFEKMWILFASLQDARLKALLPLLFSSSSWTRPLSLTFHFLDGDKHPCWFLASCSHGAQHVQRKCLFPQNREAKLVHFDTDAHCVNDRNKGEKGKDI